MDDKEVNNIGIDYPLAQLEKALKASMLLDLRPFRSKADKWQRVIEGMLSGSFDVGSRKPLKDKPVWITPEVVTGGFVTGSLLAGGDLTAHEKALVDKLGYKGESPREFLNAYHLSDDGLQRCREFLINNNYKIDVPEEGALLVICWLIDNGYHKASIEVLEEIGPYFSQLRFFPSETDVLELGSQKVFLQSAGQVSNSLRLIKPNNRVLKQKIRINVWNPFYDRMVIHLSLLFKGSDVSVFNLITPSDDWKLKASGMVDEYKQLKSDHGISQRLTKRGAQFAHLFDILCRLSKGEDISNEKAYLQTAIKRYVAKHGMPGSPEHQRIRSTQETAVASSLHSDIAKLVVNRLSSYNANDGLSEYEKVCQPVSVDEASSSILQGEKIPGNIVKKVGRGQISTIEDLIEQGYITSADTIATALPQISSNINALVFDDKQVRSLYKSIYQAFRKRRSLLLMNYQSQVRLEELPWISVLEQYKNVSELAESAAKQVMREVVCLVLTNFPHAIIPNKLLQELRALAKVANIRYPLVDEVAADIFMGGFSSKFSEAAHIARKVLSDSLYSRYYGIDYELLGETDSGASKRDADNFSKYCRSLAGDKASGWGVAANGLIIEQQQIVTSQNLATVFWGLELADYLKDDLFNMSKKCFEWVCHQLQLPLSDVHARLIKLKNSAYAMRQMLFYVSQLGKDEQESFTAWIHNFLSEQDPSFVIKFSPMITGIEDAIRGETVSKDNRFLGWTVGEHPLL